MLKWKLLQLTLHHWLIFHKKCFWRISLWAQEFLYSAAWAVVHKARRDCLFPLTTVLVTNKNQSYVVHIRKNLMFHKDNIRSVYKLGFLKLRCLLGPMPRNSCIKSKFTSFPLMSSMNYWLLYFPASMMEIPISMKLFLMYLTNGIFFLLSLLIICIYLFYFVRQSFS